MLNWEWKGMSHCGNTTLFTSAAIHEIPCMQQQLRCGLPPSKPHMVQIWWQFGALGKLSRSCLCPVCGALDQSEMTWAGVGGFACVWLQLGETQQFWFSLRLSFWAHFNPSNETRAGLFIPALRQQNSRSIFLKRCKVKSLQSWRVPWEISCDLTLPCVLTQAGTLLLCTHVLA